MNNISQKFILNDVFHTPVKRTIFKIKKHLASII